MTKNSSLRKNYFQTYLINSTLIGIFSEAFLFHFGFDFKIVYIIVLINSALFISVSKYRLKKSFNYFLLILALVSLILSLFYQTPISTILFQLVGIFIMGNYFSNFFQNSCLTVDEIFRKYYKYSYYLSILGLCFLVIFLIFRIDIAYELSEIIPFYGYVSGFSPSIRIKSILLEPAHFAGIILPAFYYSLKHFKKEKTKLVIFSTTLIFTFSSIGYLGILLSIILIAINSSLVKKVSLVSLGIIAGIFAFNKVEDFSMRLTDTFKVFSNQNSSFEGINVSTYTLYANFFVTSNVLKDSPLWGHGLASHPVSYDRYISDWIYERDSHLNKQDANSLALRILSELGIIGLLGALYFIKRNYCNDKEAISSAILIYFVYKLLREGHYFSPEMYFFIFMFIKLKYNSVRLTLMENENK